MSSIVIVDDGTGSVDSNYLARFLSENDHKVEIEYDVGDAISFLGKNGGGLTIIETGYRDFHISSWKMAVDQILSRVRQAQIIVVIVSRNPEKRLAEEVKQKGALGPVADINSRLGREELRSIINRLGAKSKSDRPKKLSNQK